ncbi:hypothetical protein PV326_010571, partial [Microctonus aethiopoides]
LTINGFPNSIFDHQVSNYGGIENSHELENYSESEDIEVENNILVDPDFVPEEFIASNDSLIRISSRLVCGKYQNTSQEVFQDGDNDDKDDADTDDENNDDDVHDHNDDGDDDDDDDDDSDPDDCSIIHNNDVRLCNQRTSLGHQIPMKQFR